MYSRLRCVALRTVRYDDRRNIVTVWSAERGRIGLVVPAGSSREASRRRALMMPLGLFECEADVRPGSELLNVRDVRPMAVLPSVNSSPAKTVVAMFLAEVLEKVLRESPPDTRMWDFIFSSVVVLDGMSLRGTANFPLVFLCRLGGMLGIEPDVSEWKPGRFFDMTEGLYRQSAPLDGKWLAPDEAAVAAIVQRMTYASANRLSLSRHLRREILDRILNYYTLHLARLDTLKSLPVVRDLL